MQQSTCTKTKQRQWQ